MGIDTPPRRARRACRAAPSLARRRWIAFAVACASALLGAQGAARAAGAPAALADPVPPLRAAHEALEAGRATEALTWLSMVEAPLVADHVDRLKVAARLERGEYETAAAAAERFAREHPDSPVRGWVAALEGDARQALGQGPAARAAWARAKGLARDDATRAELAAARARSLAGEGRLEDAAKAWLVVWSTYAASDPGPEADAAIDALIAAGAPEPRDARAYARRAQAFDRARSNAAAREAAEHAVSLGLPLKAARTMRELSARMLFRERRYPEAVEAWARLAPDREARLMHARSLARAGRIDDSIAAFEKLAAEGGRVGARAAFLVGTLYDGEEGGAEDARRSFEAAATGRATPSLRRSARWRLGWLAYTEGRFDLAERQFDALADDQARDDEIGSLRARYWHGRALERRDAEAGAQHLRALAASHPFTYYGWRAAARAGRGDGAGRTDGAGRGQGRGPLPEARIARDRLERCRILLAAGLLAEAELEIDLLARAGGGMAERAALARLYRDAGAYHEAQRLIVDAAREDLARGLEPARRVLWEHAWPLAFADSLQAGVREAGEVPAGLVFAVMREESGYRPEVVSRVGARGLVQIMPETGRQLASRRGWSTFDPDRLFEPDTNLALGAQYLAELLARFDGRAAPAVASYNAGPAAVGRWVRERGDLPEDEWVESIPYDQTRGYVRRVLRSLYVYRALYGTELAGDPSALTRSQGEQAAGTPAVYVSGSTP